VDGTVTTRGCAWRGRPHGGRSEAALAFVLVTLSWLELAAILAPWGNLHRVDRPVFVTDDPQEYAVPRGHLGDRREERRQQWPARRRPAQRRQESRMGPPRWKAGRAHTKD
jgi:hypothetical protein